MGQIEQILKDIEENVNAQHLTGEAAIQAFILAHERVITIEGLLQKRVDLLVSAVKLGNNLFDFFADIFIDESVHKKVQIELQALNSYLVGISRIAIAPMSFDMMAIRSDDILGGLIDE